MILNEGRSILSKNVIDTFCKQITEFFFFFSDGATEPV